MTELRIGGWVDVSPSGVTVELPWPRATELRNATISTRPMGEADRSYVMSTWLHSYWSTARGIEYRHRPEAYFLRLHDLRIKEALQEGARVTVAFDPDFPRVIAGWMANTTTALHYLYVRKELRRMGVARALLATAPSSVWAHSHVTPDWARLLDAGVLKTVHRPGHFPPGPVPQLRAA